MCFNQCVSYVSIYSKQAKYGQSQADLEIGLVWAENMKIEVSHRIWKVNQVHVVPEHTEIKCHKNHY